MNTKNKFQVFLQKLENKLIENNKESEILTRVFEIKSIGGFGNRECLNNSTGSCSGTNPRCTNASEEACAGSTNTRRCKTFELKTFN